MLEGILTGAAMQSMQELFTDPAKTLGMVDRSIAELGSAPASEERDSHPEVPGRAAQLRGASPARRRPARAAGPGWKPLEIERREVRREKVGPRSAFDFTFPQGILWGVIGSALGFALSLVTERTRGTLLRLETSPLSRLDVLVGKALACFVAIAAVETMLLLLGVAFFGIRPASWLAARGGDARGGGLLRGDHDDGGGAGEDRAVGRRPGLGHHDAALHVRRRHDPALRHARPGCRR